MQTSVEFFRHIVTMIPDSGSPWVCTFATHEGVARYFEQLDGVPAVEIAKVRAQADRLDFRIGPEEDPARVIYACTRIAVQLCWSPDK